MSATNAFPSFEQLFGELNFKKVDEGRSVYSPAAYLADLLQLLEDHFGRTNTTHPEEAFFSRREDVEHILLNGDQAFTALPYLDLVNRILEAKIALAHGGKAADEDLVYRKLREAKFPFQLPFSLQDERYKKYLSFLQTAAEQLYRYFNEGPADPAITAREYLGLSPEAYEMIVSEPTDAKSFLQAHYGLSGTIADSHQTLKRIEQYLDKTKLSGLELRKLLFQQLSRTAKTRGRGSSLELEEAQHNYINHGTKGYAKLPLDDDQAEEIDWGSPPPVNAGNEQLLQNDWFKRVSRASRLLRLSRYIDISLSDLDLILRSCCRNTLDAAALQTIAVIKKVSSDNELDIDVVCSMISEIPTSGIGDEKTPADLFNRIFNEPFIEIEHSYLLAYQYIPRAYAEHSQYRQLARINGLSQLTTEQRDRLQKALRISRRDLNYIINKYRVKYLQDNDTASPLDGGATSDLPVLSVLYRLSKLTEITELSYRDLFDLLDVLQDDPAIRTFAQFPVLVHYPVEEENTYEILLGASRQTDDHTYRQKIRSGLWLLQVLPAMAKWMEAHDLAAEEVRKIVSGKSLSKEAVALLQSDDHSPRELVDALESMQKKEDSALRQSQIGMLNEVYHKFRPHFYHGERLVSDRFDRRSAEAIHRSLVARRMLLAAEDSRILNFDPEKAREEVAAAINKLFSFESEDLLYLGVEDKMLDKIFNNLVIKGYIDGDGRLQEKLLPANEQDFSINKSDTGESIEIFDLIHGIYRQSNGNGESASSLEYAVYLSDLDGLNLSKTRKTELYDNLIFNGYIDEEGNVLQPDFFAKSDNRPEFRGDAKIKEYSPQVYQLIKEGIARFKRAKLKLKTDIFNHLPLQDIEKADLIENLKFNGYIDADGYYTDKQKLLDTSLDDFLLLPLLHYYHGEEILKALKQQVSELKDTHYTLTREMLRPVAARIVADRIYNRLQQNHLEDGQFSAEQRAFFRDSSHIGDFKLGPYFTNTAKTVVFRSLAKYIDDAEQYRLTYEDLAKLQLAEEDLDELFMMLRKGSYLTASGQIVPDRLTYFLNPNNALVFSLEGFDDYNRDIFFSIRSIAVSVSAAIEEIVEKLRQLSLKQEQILFDALQEVLELPADIVQVVLRRVMREPSNIVAAFLYPLLRVVNQDDIIEELPNQNRFNTAMRRIRQIAMLANKMRFGKEETEVVFQDQQLVEKFPENIELPPEITRFDALLEGWNDRIYLFFGDRFWVYDGKTYELLEKQQPLSELTEVLKGVKNIDAAFTDPQENVWIIAADQYFCKAKDSKRWKAKSRIWGKVESNFSDPDRIDAAFVDREGKTYLFSGHQYVRYSGAYSLKKGRGSQVGVVDEGYPKRIRDNWKHELAFDLPEMYHGMVQAALESPDDKTYIFKDKHFICSSDYTQQIDINKFWGKVRNNFVGSSRLDAALTHQGMTYVFAGDQVMRYRDGIEHQDVLGAEGSLIKLESLFSNTEGRQMPEQFEDKLSAAFKGFDDKVHLFSDDQYLRLSGDMSTQEDTHATSRHWGRIQNNIRQMGVIDAAMAGADGRTYLFSGSQYYRYSRADYAYVDEGYPRMIMSDWAGLARVDAAFIVDGKTYLFGQHPHYGRAYVRYSTSDYSQMDKGYPRQIDDNWWNLPEALVKLGFNTPDAVFIGKDNSTYLFKGEHYIAYDLNHRWWKEPRPAAEKWSEKRPITAQWEGLPFRTVAAAFTGKDGRTYLFGGYRQEEWGEEMARSLGDMADPFDQPPSHDLLFVRYSDKLYNKIDDRFPKKIAQHWGRVVNNIEKTGKVDAAVTVISRMTEVDEQGEERELQPQEHTYLFSGNQFFRYTGRRYAQVDEGYPRYIASSLKEEPRFRNMKGDFSEGVDAAFADQRNVYLFKGERFEVISELAHKVYQPTWLDDSFRCAFMEDGSLYIENSSGWQQANGIESTEQLIRKQLPRILRRVPMPHRETVDAILRGADGYTYVFDGPQCYNVLLNKSYPLKEEWGRLRNNIQVQNRIDAAFTGQDGKVYLFSGEQFVVYQPAADAPDTIPALIDGQPKKIKDHWGGLQQVHLAFIKEDKTYLLDQPDAEGRFRYVCYQGDDYRRPMYEEPQTADFETWEVLSIPSFYVQEGFTTVEAILEEGDSLFLLNRDSFIQYSKTDEIWTYPRPLNRIWRNMPLDRPDLTEFTPDLAHVRTAFTGPDGTTYFFSDDAFVSYRMGVFSELKEIQSRWGWTRNNIAQQERVDAAVMIDGETTFLFSGDQYVRYTGSDYRFVDDGYPKKIVDSLRQEAAFSNLPADFEDRISVLLEAGGRLDAVVADDRNIYMMFAQQCHVISRELSHTYDLQRIGRLRNNIASDNHIDAAYVNDKDHTLLFSGDQFFRYSKGHYDYVDEGYPKPIAGMWAKTEGMKELPETMHYGLDAAFRGVDDIVYLFKGKEFFNSRRGVALPVKQFWGQIQNLFMPADGKSNVAVDAMFIAPDKRVYVFKKDQYLRYSSFENEFADEGYPRFIQDHWGDLPNTFEKGIEGAFVFEGKTYLTKGEEYVRYSDPSYSRIDRIYPQRFTDRWRHWNDLLIHDLYLISRYARMNEQYSTADYNLTEFFYGGRGHNKEPYRMLAELFDWEVEEVKWIKRRNAFLQAASPFEVDFSLEQVIRMYDIFKLTDKMGAAPSEVYRDVWQARFRTRPDLEAAADALYRYLGRKNSTKDWEVLSRQMHNEMNLLKRDALLPYLISLLGNVNNSRDLFNHLLIDVDMGSIAETSRIKEAISALQLYFHRFFVSLEDPDTSAITEQRRRELKEWWKWMKNYRVWEANRKVFLYPENYIRPELRDTKTPQFKQLEEALLQGELNRELVETAFKDYLDSFAVVSNLRISGANIYREGDDDVLVLFGHTRTDPMQYYYRTVKFEDDMMGDHIVDWQPWQPVDISINSTRVFPIHAFGRLMVFWIEIEELEESEAKLLNKEEEKVAEVNTSKSKLSHQAHIKYAFFNHNKKWSQPQLLKGGIELKYEIDAAYVEGDKTMIFAGRYCLMTSPSDPSGEVKTIGEYAELSDLPAEFQNGIDAATIFRGRRYFFKGGECVIQSVRDNRVQRLKLKDLIARPSGGKLMVVVRGPFGIAHSVEIDTTNEALAEHYLRILGAEVDLGNPFPRDGFDAAFDLNNEVLCLIDKKGSYFFYRALSNGRLVPIQDMQQMAGRIANFPLFITTIANKSGSFAPADAVFKTVDPDTGDNKLFVIRDGEFECYSNKGFALIPLDGFPKPIKGNLSFNMDKFFNKLHLSWDGMEDGMVSITYTNPKDKLLLSGRLEADFTFEEVSVEDNKAKHALLQWNGFTTANLRDYPDSIHDAEARNLTDSLDDEIATLEDRVRKLQTLTQAADALNQATTHVSTVLSGANRGAKQAAREGFAQEITGVQTNAGSLTSDAYSGIREIATALNQAANGLQADFNNFSSADSESLQAAENQLNQENERARNTVSRSRRNISGETTNAATDALGLNQAFQATGAGLSKVNNSFLDHFNTSLHVDEFHRSIRSDLNTWSEATGTDRSSNVPTLATAEARRIQYVTANNSFQRGVRDGLADLLRASRVRDLDSLLMHLGTARTKLSSALSNFANRAGSKATLDGQKGTILREMANIVNNIKEQLLGRFDLFPNDFGIQNKTNFTFSEPDWFVFEAERGTFLCRPLRGAMDESGHPYEIIRLTTSVNPFLSSRLFTGGLPALLSLATQRLDEQPRLLAHGEAVPQGATGRIIRYNRQRIAKVPESDNLDFGGANGIYYQELFFHAPYLIAQSLNTAQKFEEAKEWYEFIFDPTAAPQPWRYLPFVRPEVETNFLLDPNQMKRYLNDPFDPHAIAALRPSAYRKAIVMNYIDNLLDWGDRLFRQYTAESINEARMLYILAYDLLGDKPQNLGVRIPSMDKTYAQLRDATNEPDFHLLEMENALARLGNGGAVLSSTDISDTTVIPAATPNDNMVNPYFYIPENGLFLEYWNRVEDRLYKIRQSLNIDGEQQPLALFEPPIDPMALVQAVASGAGIGQAIAGLDVAVPHYRFSFMMFKAKELVQKLNQFGGELLATLEKKDAEEMSRLQLRQESELLDIMRKIREAQLAEAQTNIDSLEASLRNAEARIDHYDELISAGMSALEISQLTFMSLGAGMHFASSIGKIVSAIVSTSAPDALVGPFIMGVKYGGGNTGDGLNTFAEVAQTMGEGFTMIGEALGVAAQFERMTEDWVLQKDMAVFDKQQIEAQIAGAKLQKLVAQYEIEVMDKEIAHNRSMSSFLRDKFTNAELYQWMSSRLSGMYYQTYKLAYDMAKYAEKAFRFERGMTAQQVNFIQPVYWNSQRKGLLAGEHLGLDLDRMEQAYITSDKRLLEISKNVSLLELDPMAFLEFKQKGVCEFSLSEALFDYDFPGHYCRQIKTVSLSFDIGEGKYVDAMLTQLSHKTVLEPDTKAVKHLLDPRNRQPLSIRSNWRANQQIALSHFDEYEKNNGLFELRFDTDRYLPFEGTGAVSNWRLELKGKPGAVDINDLVDLVVNVKYTAINGGEAFAETVKGMLKPYPAVRFLDLNFDFHEQWMEFLESDSEELTLNMSRELFPNMGSGKINGIFSKFDLVEPGNVSLILNNDEEMVLKDGKAIDTTALSISSRGSQWTLRIKGNKQLLRTVYLVLGYKATVR